MRRCGRPPVPRSGHRQGGRLQCRGHRPITAAHGAGPHLELARSCIESIKRENRTYRLVTVVAVAPVVGSPRSRCYKGIGVAGSVAMGGAVDEATPLVAHTDVKVAAT